jgi:hypothetical protein
MDMKIKEQYAQYLWDAKRIPFESTTLSGAKLRVYFPGHWNRQKGPDFRNALFYLDDQLIQGDVEIHLKGSDWRAHGHHTDPAFDSVALHVVYSNTDTPPCNSSGHPIETVCLDPDTAPEPSALPAHCPAHALIHREFLGYWLEQRGKKRIRAKAERYATCFPSNPDQCLYEALFEAFGYTRNQEPMRSIAQSVPFSQVRDVIRMKGKPVDILVQWLSMSGLFAHIPASIPLPIRNAWLERSQRLTTPSTPPEWNLFRIRPDHHPVIRLIQLAGFFARDIDLFTSIRAPFENPDFRIDRFLTRFRNAFSPLEGDFIPLPHPGDDFIRIVTVNVLIPLLLIGYKNDVEQERRVWDILPKIRCLPGNRIEKEMLKRLPATARIRRNALHQQGLIDLHHQYCESQKCTACVAAMRADLGLSPNGHRYSPHE